MPRTKDDLKMLYKEAARTFLVMPEAPDTDDESGPSSARSNDTLRTDTTTGTTQGFIPGEGILDIDAPLPSDIEPEYKLGEIFLEKWNQRVIERKTFREKNLKPNRESFEKLVRGRKLDSSLKKCTAFVRKLKQFAESQKPSIKEDMDQVNLTKYQAEITSVIVDTKFKYCEMPAIINVCSEFHHRYAEFADTLMEKYRSALPTLKMEMKPANISKAASDMRLFAELILSGILPLREGIELLHTSIKNVVRLDKDGLFFIVPFTVLLKGLTDELLGLFSYNNASILDTYGVRMKQLLRSEILREDQKEPIRETVLLYFASVTNTVVERHQKVLNSERQNRKLLETKGEIPKDRMDEHDKINTKFVKYHTNALRLAGVLDMVLPELEVLPPEPVDEIEKALFTSETGELITETPGIILFDNEETRQFYQDYPDLKVYLPPVVYRDAIVQMQEKTKRMEEKEKMVDDFDEATEQAELQDEREGLAEEDEESKEELDGDVPPSMRDAEKEEEKDVPAETKETIIQPQKQTFQNYLDTLQHCVNKNMIDKAAIEFAESFNNKRHRRELVRKLFHAPRQRLDLLSLYSRLVAILSKVFPDIGIDLSNMLIKDLRYLVRKKDQIKIESKLKISRFIGELVNFHIFPKSEAFVCLKMLLQNFVHHQIEMACALVETCGRVLFRSSDSHRRMKIYLDEMLRKKIVLRLDRRYVYMIDNSYFHICPPPESNIPRKVRVPIHAYVEYVLWEDLNKNTIERAHRVLRLYDWDDPDKRALVIKVLTAPWKFSYVQMESAATLLTSIRSFHPSLTSDVIEDLVEQIRLGCEYEHDDYNTVRMAAGQFLAYIYTYKGLKNDILFSLWYYMITFGVTYRQDITSKMDPPASLHRVRVICQMLRIVSDYVTGGSSKRRMNSFLKYFQRYFVHKRTLSYWDTAEFPFAVEEYYIETFRRIRSNWWLALTLEQAEYEIDQMETNIRDKASKPVQNMLNNPMTCVQVRSNVSPREIPEKDTDDTDPEEYDQAYSEFVMSLPDAGEYLVPGYHSRDLPTIDPYEMYNLNNIACSPVPEEPIDDDQEFLAAFEKLCNEGIQQNRAVPRAVDLPLPVGANTDSSAETGLVKVTLLTKKHNRPKVKTVDVSAEEDFIVSLRSREEEEKEEKQEMKTRTLAITRLQEEEERRSNLPKLSTLVFTRSDLQE